MIELPLQSVDEVERRKDENYNQENSPDDDFGSKWRDYSLYLKRDCDTQTSLKCDKSGYETCHSEKKIGIEVHMFRIF